jgi:hypothetical protein
MPHLVEMHRRYANEGLALVTVSLDSPGAVPTALRVLQAQRVDGPNFNLTNPSALATGGYRFNVIPTVFVFDRAGRGHKFEGNVNLDQVELLIQQYLKL